MEKNLTDIAEEALVQITATINSARVDASNARRDFLKANLARFCQADLVSLRRDIPKRFTAGDTSIAELLAPMSLDVESVPALGYIVWHCCVTIASERLGPADEESMVAFPLDPDSRDEFNETSTLVASWPGDRFVEVSFLLDEAPDVMVAADTTAALLQFDTAKLRFSQVADLRLLGYADLAELKLD